MEQKKNHILIAHTQSITRIYGNVRGGGGDGIKRN